MLSATDGIRFAYSDCGSAAPNIERTVDGGRTWLPVADIGQALGSAIAVTVAQDGRIELIGQRADSCQLAGFVSYTGGEFWAIDDSVTGGATYIDPATGSAVVDGVNQGSPCSVVFSLVDGPEGAAALCGDGVFTYSATEGGWRQGRAGSIFALGSADKEGDILGATDSIASCPGTTVETLDLFSTSGPPSAASCLPASGPIALTTTNGTAFAWIGDSMYTSNIADLAWVKL